MYARLQLLLQVADNPEYCPAPCNVSVEDAWDDEVLGHLDTPVTAPKVGDAPAKVACYRVDAEPILVIAENLGTENVSVETHDGTSAQSNLLPAGKSIMAWHQADHEPQVSFASLTSDTCDCRCVMV